MKKHTNAIIVLVILLLISSAYAQYEELLKIGVKFLINEYIKDKEAREKIKEIQTTYDAWIKSLGDYISKTDKVGDCKTIGFRPLSSNNGESSNFYYECGTDEGGSIAFLRVKNKIKIGTCDNGSQFTAEFDIVKKELYVFSFPINDACVFFQPGGCSHYNYMLGGGMCGGSAGELGTKAKGSLKAPSARDINMGSNASRSKVEIMAVVNGRMPDLRNIYNKYLKLKPGFSGNVILKFTIVPGGNIASISIVSSTTGYDEFDNAVKNMVATWKWKDIKNGDTTPTIPFEFKE